MVLRVHELVVVMLIVIVVAAVQVLLVTVVVDGLPTGAAGCDGGGAAVRGFHLQYRDINDENPSSFRSGQTGSLSKFNTTFKITSVTMIPISRVIRTLPMNETMPPTATPTLAPTTSPTTPPTTSPTTPPTIAPSIKPTIQPTIPKEFYGGTELEWMVEASDPELLIRGVLLRVQPINDDVMFTLTGDVNLQPSEICLNEKGNVQGMTHRSRVRKQFVSGTMQFDHDGIVIIDLTIVYMNGRVAPEDMAIHAYNQFELDIQNSPPTTSVSMAPIPPPTKYPVEDRCVTNACSMFFGLIPGRKYNRFRGGRCRERCSAINFFVLPIFGWRCGGCF